MMQKSAPFLVFALFVSPLVSTIPVVAQDDDELQAAERERRMATMSKLIDELRVFENIDGQEVELERGAQPVTHFNDSVRHFEDGTLWAFTRNGRPIALIKCSTNESSSRRWWYSLASLSTNPLRAVNTEGSSVWTPQTPGVEYSLLPSDNPPASTSTRRRLQLRKLARRFHSHQFWKPENQRFELRLSPRPVLTYSDESAGVTDAGVFIFTHGVTPALAVIIEAIDGENNGSWRYAIAKLGSAEFHALLDDQTVYKSPRAPGVTGRPIDPYFLYSMLTDD